MIFFQKQKSSDKWDFWEDNVSNNKNNFIEGVIDTYNGLSKEFPWFQPSQVIIFYYWLTIGKISRFAFLYFKFLIRKDLKVNLKFQW